LGGFDGESPLFGLFELLESLFSLSLLSFLVDGTVALFLGKLGVYSGGGGAKGRFGGWLFHGAKDKVTLFCLVF
jgi:hypothetical protein